MKLKDILDQNRRLFQKIKPPGSKPRPLMTPSHWNTYSRSAKIGTKKKPKFFPFPHRILNFSACASRRLSHFLYFLIRLEKKKRETWIYRQEREYESGVVRVDEHDTECRIWSIPPRLGPLATRSKKLLDYQMISSCPLVSNMSFFSFYSNIGNFNSFVPIYWLFCKRRLQIVSKTRLI